MEQLNVQTQESQLRGWQKRMKTSHFTSTDALDFNPPRAYIQSLPGATAVTAGQRGVLLQHSRPHHVHISVQVIQ